MKVEASNLVSAINQLPKNQAYEYVSPITKEKILIADIVLPEGPIKIKRYNPSKGETLEQAKEDSISTQMVWRIANAVSEGMPINFDRILGGSYNTRSVLESLLAHTPEFYYAYPGQIESTTSSTQVKKGHKHLIWCPNKPHQMGVVSRTETDVVISEIPTAEAIYESMTLPELPGATTMDIDLARRHAQIQIALLFVGRQLGSKVRIAKNDRGIEYRGHRLAEMDGVLPRLDDVKFLALYQDAIRAATLIDCIWFRNSRFMPAVFEIEHSTGVTSGLARMKNFKDKALKLSTRWVIVGPDDIRDKVYQEANKPLFADLNPNYFPYSAVEELYSLCQRRHIGGVSDEFLDSFMEKCIQN
jgi:type II restriction enzyme